MCINDQGKTFKSVCDLVAALTLKLLNMPSLDETGIKMADYTDQNAQVVKTIFTFSL